MRRNDAVEIVGTLGPEEARALEAALARCRSDALWLDAHRDELLREYPERWVAVFDGRVVATAAELRDLIDQLDAGDGLRERAVIEFVSDEDIDLIVHCA
jgi:hypothetical protein